MAGGQEVAGGFDPHAFFSEIGGAGKRFPMPKFATAPDVRREVKQRATAIFETWTTLREVLARHEATVQRRWSKKSKAQRLQILLKAWPNMPLTHRPDFEAFRRESEPQRDAGTKYRQDYLWPYINQEDLSKPRALPLLLNARGRHFPSEFAGADADVTRFGFIAKTVVPVFLNLHTMILNGVTESNTGEYGKLISWDDNDDAFNWFHTKKQFQPGEGLLVLESQERLLRFLLECCRLILHEIPAESWVGDSFPIQPEPELKSESESTGFESLTVMAAEAPYRVPAELDLAKVESLLSARASAAEDRLWALREDPLYFYEQLLDSKEHRTEMVKDVRGRLHPSTEPLRDNIIWSRVIRLFLTEVFLQLEMYAELRQQAQAVQALQARYAAAISPMQDLPAEYMRALLKFRFTLNRAAKDILRQLQRCGAPSPPLRHLFVRNECTDVNESHMQLHSKSRVGKTKVETNLLWLLGVLWNDGDDLFLTGLANTVDELQRLLEAEPEAKRLISSHVAEVIGDLAVVTESLRQIDLYHPWARGYDNALLDLQDELAEESKKSREPWDRIRACTEAQHVARSVQLLDPFKRRFPYPVDKRRTKENVAALRQAERNLDRFWVSIDLNLRHIGGDISSTATSRVLSQNRTLQRTPEWVEAPPRAETKPSPPGPTGDLYSPLSALSLGDTSTSGIQKPTPRAKVKTKGTPNPPAETAAPELIPNPADQQPTLAVDGRALKVFRVLFFNPEVTSTPGEVAWTDFLHAMAATGFVAEKLYGSVWQFQPTRLDVDKAIQFHEPHPKGKIPFWTARRHGRRLWRAYGWVGGMFVLGK
ncbi:hypothetical protein BT67DRAFT_412777 [Trichocladium antarcticum]|uniref:Uncharacterized protein n=1 Tax=Trichocladium antarcticum TaxID=1450529 RepID=A0AAN6UTA8_9PEZI|nr:hypothetical protein BT67DRAFT_412777 [Trichocladium antarcticum]